MFQYVLILFLLLYILYIYIGAFKIQALYSLHTSCLESFINLKCLMNVLLTGELPIATVADCEIQRTLHTIVKNNCLNHTYTPTKQTAGVHNLHSSLCQPHARDQNESSPRTHPYKKIAEEGIHTKFILIRETFVISAPRLKDCSIRVTEWMKGTHFVERGFQVNMTYQAAFNEHKVCGWSICGRQFQNLNRICATCSPLTTKTHKRILPFLKERI